jgi:hypothetical protein
VDFLRGIIEGGQAIRLVSLEVQDGVNDDDDDMSEAISTFLGVFEGLENLYVAHFGPADTIAFWRSMLHHKSTLTRFACHLSVMDIDEDSSHYEEDFDLLDLSLLGKDVAKLRGNPLLHPFQELNQECIGLCCDAYYLV